MNIASTPRLIPRLQNQKSREMLITNLRLSQSIGSFEAAGVGADIGAGPRINK